MLLGLALAWAKLRNRGVNRDTDTPSDDPSKGMTGHDWAVRTGREARPRVDCR